MYELLSMAIIFLIAALFVTVVIGLCLKFLKWILK